MPFKCDQCDKEFNTQQGLDQHKSDKHGVSRHEKKEMKKEQRQEQRKETSNAAKKKKMTKYAIIAVVIVAFVGVGYYAVSAWPQKQHSQDILSTNLYGHTGMALHIHPNLEIEILGEKQTIPANIGISGSAMRVIHTHDDTGKLHVESPVPHTFILKDFFTIWGKSFNVSCIFEYCANETHSLSFFVNGQPNDQYENLLLKDMDNIRIMYAAK